MGKIDSFYQKYKISISAYLGSSIAWSSIIIAIILFVIGNPSFNFFSYFVSHLGTIVGSNYSFIAFSLGMITVSFILPLFYNNLTEFLIENTKSNAARMFSQISFYFGVLASIGVFIIAIFPMDLFEFFHDIGSFLYFSGGAISMLIYSTVELFIKKVSKFFPIYGYIVSIFYIGYPLFSLINPLLLPVSLIFEWLMLFSFIIWVPLHGYLMQKLS
ncbi:MAG: hypothetical protein ACTSXH_04885 [Promethearchaeota archaeon]